MISRVNLTEISQSPNSTAIIPPTASRLQRLPLNQLSWENFERLCVRLASKDTDAEFAQAYGVRGQNQEGIDLYIRKKSNNRYVVWQCKRHEKYSKSDVSSAVLKFIKSFKAKESGIPIKDADLLILAVTADLSKTDIVNEIERLNKRLKRRLGISLITYDIQGLSDKLKPHVDLVADFFSAEWVEEFCAKKQVNIGDAASGAGDIIILRAAFEGLDSYGNKDLDQIRDLWGERHERDALIELEKFKQKGTWPALSAEVRAKTLRLEAGLMLQIGDKTTAKQLLNQAKQIAPNANARVLDAKIIHEEQGAAIALAFLGIPVSDDERVQRWNLLLELGRPSEVTDEFRALNRTEVPPGDFAAVLSLAQLALLDVPSADQTIQGSLKKKPRHVASRHVAALVDYYWGISPAFRAWGHMTWPVPPPFSMVKRDIQSQERRQRAAVVFADLAATVLREQCDLLQGWQLACVALNSENPDEPSKLARECLAVHPANLPVLVWASSLGLEFDRAKSMAAMCQLMEGNEKTLDDLLVLLGLLSDTNDLISYGELLARHRPLFEQAGRLSLWYLHQSQILIERGDTDEALKLMQSMPESVERGHIQSIIYKLVADRTKRQGDYQLLLESQKREYKENNAPIDLLECCRTSRLLQNWDFIAENAFDLVRGVNTQGALEMACEGLLHARRAKDCLDLLQNQKHLCYQGQWSPFLRQVAAEAHRQLGDLPAAISVLEHAVTKDSGLGTRIQLFNAFLSKGDLSNAVNIARSLISVPGVPVEFIVSQVIPIARHQDPELAKELIVKMELRAGELPPDIGVKLMDEAHRAGVDSVSGRLLSKFAHQATKGGGPLRAFSIEETKQLLMESQAAAGRILEGYTKGKVPAHLVSSGANIPLAELYHRMPLENIDRARPAQSPPIFIRYASDSNTRTCRLPAGGKELFLDISSFLLLDALGLISIVESTFERLHVGDSLVRCLSEQLDQLSPKQPGRATATKRVAELIGLSRISIGKTLDAPLAPESPLAPISSLLDVRFCQRLSEVYDEAGLLVDFLPIRSNSESGQIVSLPEPVSSIVISIQQLVAAMRRAGWISASDAGPKHTLIDDESGISNEVHLSEGMRVHLWHGQAEELELAGVLQTLIKKTRLTVENEEAQRLRTEAKLIEMNGDLKIVVSRLLNHVSSEVGKQKYLVHAEGSFERRDEGTTRTPERALFDAIAFAEKHNIPVCIDDRLVRRHSAVGKTILCDSWDILHHLKSHGFLDDSSFRSIRTRMRAANLRYLPVAPEEILWSIQTAPINVGQLAETPDLTILRRYVSATLLDYSTLQNPVRDNEGKVHPREGLWPTRLRLSITKALIELWSKGIADSSLETRADWIWSNLSFDDRLLAEENNSKSSDYTAVDALAEHIATMFAFGITVPAELTEVSVGKMSRRRRYLRWLWENVVTPASQNSPEITSKLGDYLRKRSLVLDTYIQKLRVRRGKPDLDTRSLRDMIGYYIADLPPELVDQLKLNTIELQELGLVVKDPELEVLGLSFSVKEFWNAIGRALARGHTTLWTVDHTTKLRIRSDLQGSAISVSIAGELVVSWKRLRLPFLAILSDNLRRRELFTGTEGHALDLNDVELSDAVRQICSLASPAERVTELLKLRERSAAALYEDLYRDVRERKKISICNLLPDDVECLRHNIRLEEDHRAVEEFAALLLGAVGWAEAFLRLCLLPVRIPKLILDLWEQKSSVEQMLMVQKFEAELVLPVERIHLIELLCHRTTKAAGSLQRAKAQLDWLTDENSGVPHCRSMLSVIRWVHLKLGWHARASKWSGFSRLCIAWTHGGALYHAFQAAGARPESVEKWFSGGSQELFSDRFDLSDPVIFDASNPSEVTPHLLILKGISSACAHLNETDLAECNSRVKLPLLLEGRSFVKYYDILSDKTLAGNLIASYLGENQEKELKWVLGEEVFDRFFHISHLSVAERALDVLSASPGDLNSMFVLHCVVGDRPMYGSLIGSLEKVLTDFDMISFCKDSAENCGQYILFFGQLAASSGSGPLKDKVWGEYLKFIRHIVGLEDRSLSNAIDHANVASLLSDAAIRLSASKDGKVAAFQSFVRKLIELCEAWPGFSKYCGQPLIEALNLLPMDCQAGLSRLMLLLRTHR